MSRADALLTSFELHEVFAPQEPAFEHSLKDVISGLVTMAFIIGGDFWIMGIFG